jgi:holo-[acyl-carrier protein] synthase
MSAVIGIGLDVADIGRLARALAASPRLRDRLFHPTERDLPVRSLAARFAAKESLAKALATSGGLHWQDCWVETNQTGQPALICTGTVAARMAELGVVRLHLSLSHDAGVAAAVVVAEGT